MCRFTISDSEATTGVVTSYKDSPITTIEYNNFVLE